MPTLLESLYYGNLTPEEQVVPKNPQYHLLSQELSKTMETWKEKLSNEEFTELEELIDLQQRIQGLEIMAAFTHGFKLGAGLMIEVFARNGVEGL